ncbi:MAG: methyltransferase type 11, partial [Terracidiphilus sp.]
MSASKAVAVDPREPVPLNPQGAYQLWAAHYDSAVNPLLALEERRMAAQFGDFSGKDIVDLGCGTGRWLKKLESCRPRSLTGV